MPAHASGCAYRYCGLLMWNFPMKILKIVLQRLFTSYTHPPHMDATNAKCCKLKYAYSVSGWLLFDNVKFLEFQKCFPFCLCVCMECDTHTPLECVRVSVYAYSVGTAMQTFWHTHKHTRLIIQTIGKSCCGTSPHSIETMPCDAWIYRIDDIHI